ncbi:MAG: VWA domain-containing protein [Planctomycetota bacterium]|nr:MAG: VWA domain-containing protein [Planctomycetota bacterium]
MSKAAFCCAAALIGSVATLGVRAEEKTIIIKVDSNTVEAKPPFEGERASVDVAILLDTSNSMDGLISQAKNQLWTIVEQFAKAEKDGKTPVLRVALFEYGNTRLPASEGYIRQVVPLTDDLDKLSEKLFELSTRGGDEYCGQVIDEAVTRLDWSEEKNGYKAIFIAGNEPFTQGSVDYRDACRRAIERGIIVNTIHCGDNAAGVSGKWQDGATIAEGEYFNIDQDRAVVHIRCPQDKIIIELNAELNRTYLWYGSREQRVQYAANQAAQDANAAQEGLPVAASRVLVKTTDAYANRSRDLVDTLEEDPEILTKVKDEELPEALRGLSLEERKAKIEEMAAKRAAVQAKINKLAAEREAYLVKERNRHAEASGGKTLGEAVIPAVQRQLGEAGFEQPGGKK